MTPPARCSLTVIRSASLEAAAGCYRALGLTLVEHSHGGGPAHLAFEAGGHIFEIYPLRERDTPTVSTRIGFCVSCVDETFARLVDGGATAAMTPRDSPWGRRAVVTDPDGHRVELTSAADSATAGGGPQA